MSDSGSDIEYSYDLTVAEVQAMIKRSEAKIKHSQKKLVELKKLLEEKKREAERRAEEEAERKRQDYEDELARKALDKFNAEEKSREEKEQKKNMKGSTKLIVEVKDILKKEYTAEKLADFDEVIIEMGGGRRRFGVNVRGDTVDGDGDYKGQYNFDTKKLTRKSQPAGWDYVERVMAGDYSKKDTIIPPL